MSNGHEIDVSRSWIGSSSGLSASPLVQTLDTVGNSAQPVFVVGTHSPTSPPDITHVMNAPRSSLHFHFRVLMSTRAEEQKLVCLFSVLLLQW